MTKIAIIGGSGLTRLTNLTITGREVHNSPYGEPSAPIVRGKLEGVDVIFLPRHGAGHTIPPHKVNYRANLFVLNQLGVENVVAINAVGGITNEMSPQVITIPDQIIDYTYSRLHTFFDEGLDKVTHIDFTQPYCETLRESILAAAKSSAIHIIEKATYAATQGPRLETAAEIDRLERDGCHVVGMTGMPEASLARELGLCYASINVVANKAAGRGHVNEVITFEEIERNLNICLENVKRILEVLIKNI